MLSAGQAAPADGNAGSEQSVPPAAAGVNPCCAELHAEVQGLRVLVKDLQYQSQCLRKGEALLAFASSDVHTAQGKLQLKHIPCKLPNASLFPRLQILRSMPHPQGSY